jgi:two-component system KDP operon response regulator KdpE
MSQARVLVVDDEAQIRQTLETNLRGADYEVETAGTAGDALRTASRWRPDAIILDLVLPDGRGSDVCRELRSWSEVPVVVLSVVDDSVEKVAALDAGADDYVTKPFEMEELLARLRAALRRSGSPRERVVKVGGIVVDLDKHAVTVNGRHLQLTRIEFELLRVLVFNCGKLLTHRAILREIWGPGYGAESHYLHVYVSQLRRKIEDDPTRPRYLLTEVGTGYRFVDPGG